MTTDRGELLEQVSTMLQPFNTKSVPISEDTDFNADLNVDSVAVMDFILAVEDEYDISIPINELADVKTVGQFLNTVERALGQA